MDGQVGGGSLRRSRSGGSVSERKNALENGSAESGRWTSTPRPSLVSCSLFLMRVLPIGRFICSVDVVFC